MRRALGLLIALFAIGCVLPAPRSVPLEALSRSDRRRAARVAPAARLGRWDGRGFVPVAAGSLPPSHLRVIVHGWAPGWGRTVMAHPGLAAWEAIDGSGRHFEPWMPELAAAITRSDPHAVVVVYSWLEDAATGRFILAQRDALAHTRAHGRLLSRALDDALAPRFHEDGGQVHLLGHSYGARVATGAALAMHGSARAPAQLTLFDAPDAPLVWVTGGQMRLGELLPALPMGWGAGRTFVENYVSMVGVRYTSRDAALDALVEVSLAPPHGAFAYRARHVYPMRFYARTAGTRIGLGWSPLTAGAEPPAPGCWEQRFGEIALERGCSGL